MVLPADNEFSTVQANLSDPNFEVSPGDYKLLFRNIAFIEEAKEGDEGVAFCLGDSCFSGEQDTNHYDIVQYGDLYFEVTNITVADAWVSTDKIFWIGYTPYLFYQFVDPELGFSTL